MDAGGGKEKPMRVGAGQAAGAAAALIPTYEMPTAKPVIITVAPSGHFIDRRHGVPVPHTPEEFAAAAEDAFHAGATVLHLHVREDDGSECLRPERYAETIEAVKARVPDMLIEVSTRGQVVNGGVDKGVSVRLSTAFWDDRDDLKADMCAVNPFSLNYPEHAFINEPDEVRAQVRLIYSLGLVPELDIFDVGHIAQVCRLVNEGVVVPPVFINVIVGSSGGMPADPATIVHAAQQIPDGFSWTILGAGRFNFHAAAIGIALGSHVRTGFEDTTFVATGRKAASNAELVAKVVRIATEYGRPIATPQQAREIILGAAGTDVTASRRSESLSRL
jgi:3-keto-5-aminohexanoate cleavage enzyme